MIRWLLNLVRRKNPVYETMTRYTFCGWTVRVWRETTRSEFGPDLEVQTLLQRHFSLTARDRKCVIDKIAGLPDVAAIEILDPDGNGGLFYPDWK